MEQHNWLIILHQENIYEYLSGMISSKSLVVTLSLTTILLLLSLGCPNFSNNLVYLELGYNWDINFENLNGFFFYLSSLES